MLDKTIGWLKKNWFTSLMMVFLVIMVVSPGAKSWVLKQFISTGFFNAEIKKETAKNEFQTTDFGFTDSAGNTATTASLKGKIVFINFWATWCPPCRAEMPSLNNLYKKLKDDDRFVFLFINEDEDQSKATAYLKKNKFSIPLFYRTGNVPGEIFSGTLPTTIVLNKEGKIVLKHEGMAGYDTEDFTRQLKELAGR